MVFVIEDVSLARTAIAIWGRGGSPNGVRGGGARHSIAAALAGHD
jgi:hypothetical protein